ncbi:AVN_HP_G0109090.mRNA.1.CDS.1 [Saccharomyces cerevisiae]|nr:AVN_HP_G0035280.mRNA.1.CDS.1 [Saccharomyces cerevisiae]CAI5021915.1 AVN_HP_G0062770.mRNA.1.CDS.1 [Saccharomyces cerevisiae]CAI5138280.1 AVN_HP_G0109090.mRNA.1.CDS.1 [Saccharomyces cerevisiae]CAI6859686.1 AVN_HP_G0035280.mRNA.1.CDS.1 [Saccharomyces cerevisiae]CAI6938426.1 AVN_HP_G0062770.mRNA.1.CDS.1 [Saccharomyces cerevisiae]
MSAPTPLAEASQIPTIPALSPLTAKQSKGNFFSSNPISSFVVDTYKQLHSHRQSLELVNPGTVENLNKEVSRDVFLSQYFFTGLRADLNKAFSMNPAFQTSHTFSIGSQALPKYAFSALFANDNLFAQGNIDNDLSVSGRLNYGWDKKNISKVNLQISDGQPTMCQLEQDYQASDFSVNVKTLNPSFSEKGEFTGVAVASFLQSVTPQLALGLETLYSRTDGSAPGDAGVSYLTRYVSKKQDWIFSGQLQANGALIASLWRKVAPNVEAGIETTLQAGMVPITDPLMGTPIGFQPTVEGSTTIGAKYEYRQSVYRGTLDSNGKVACFLERKVLPTLSVLFCGEIDHFKNDTKIGCGLQFETAGNQELLMLQQGLDADGNPLQALPQL